MSDVAKIAAGLTMPLTEKELTAAMDNVLAWRLGEACNAAAREPAGDLIDRGLALRKQLEDRGFLLIRRPEQPHGT